MRALKIVLKIILILIGAFVCLEGEVIPGICIVAVGLVINTKKKVKPPKRTPQPQRTQPPRAPMSRSMIESKKQQILAEMQMCQQQIASMEMQLQMSAMQDTGFGLGGFMLNYKIRKDAINKGYEALDDLRAQYDRLCEM